MTDDKILQFRSVEAIPEINLDAIELLEGTLARLRRGESVAVALVEVFANGGVGTAYCKSNHYHQLNSGAARLAARLAVD